MKTTLDTLYDLKAKYEQKCHERELMLMDEEVGNYLFALISAEMDGLRLAIRIIVKEIQKELE